MQKFSCKLCCNNNHFTNLCNVYTTVEHKNNRVKQLKLCYDCPRSNHIVSSCSNSALCRGCGRKHHTVLCRNQTGQMKEAGKITSPPDGGKDLEPLKENKVSNPNTDKTKKTTTMTVHSTSMDSFSNILPTAELTLIENDTTVNCKALLDSGSQKSFILSSICDKLKLKTVGNATLSVDGFDSCGDYKQYKIVNLKAQTSEGIVSVNAIVVEAMPTRLTMPGRDLAVRKLKKLGFTLSDPSESNVFSDLSIILGVDNVFKFLYADEISDSLFTLPSKLGTLIAGNVSCNTANTVTTVLKVAVFSPENNLDDELKKLWQLDQIGISEPEIDNDESYISFKNSVRYRDGKYTAKLPWKSSHPVLPDNKQLAWQRFQSLWKSLHKNSDVLKMYNYVMEEQINLGFVEEINTQNDHLSTNKIHYLPHHAVTKQSLTTPLRVVFDCSAKVSKNHPSLNDCLITGPPMLNELASILLRFRLNSFACSADIAKAFLMIGLDEGDRDSCRFFWPANPFDPESKIKIFRFKVVLFGSTASQFLLNCTISHYLEKFNNQCSSAISRNLYVDNVHFTCSDEVQLVKFYHESCSMMNSGGFLLREWKSNSRNLKGIVRGSDSRFDSRSDSCSDSQSVPSSKVKVLGLSWNTDNDTLSVEIPSIKFSNPVTKRSVVSALAKIFDPLGLLLPITVRGKILIQDLWREKIGWDQVLSEQLTDQFLKLIGDLGQFKACVVPRCLNILSKPALHVFADASMHALGVVAYLVEAGSVNLVMAKSRLVPISAPSLPQLELTALNIAAKLAKFIKCTYCNELDISETRLWTDSNIVICWIKQNSHKKQYVTQRINNIKALCPAVSVSHVSGNENPADLLTRGLNVKEFRNNKLWEQGPCWLASGDWSQDLLNNSEQGSEDLESDITENVSINSIKVHDMQGIIPIENYSAYSKCIRVTSYILRYIKKLKYKVASSMFTANVYGERGKVEVSTVAEMNEAEFCLIKLCQAQHYPEIVSYFANENNRVPNLVQQLKLFSNNGIIRSAGRIKHSQLPESSKYPILLPSKSYVAMLIIREIHFSNCHAGPAAVLTFLRERFWIPRARQIIKKSLRKCVKCLKIYGKPYSKPAFPDLPHCRVNEARPFQVTGVDYTGALQVKTVTGIHKAYIVVFTCAVTRAAHLEVVESLLETEFIDAFIRFCSRRSFPQIIYSDNATTFVGASKSLKDIANSNKVKFYMNDRRIEWRFITPRAPWQGGIWERLVGLTKSALKRVLGKSMVSFRELETLTIQIEAKLNDRPLTYASDDVTDLQPLSPSQLLFGFRLREFPNVVDINEIIDPSYLTPNRLSRRQVRCALLLEQFWKRWKTEYLTALRERSLPGVQSSIVRKGHVVIIDSDNHTPRASWQLGVITEIIKSSDNIVRSVKLRTAVGNLVRPIAKLYPLEITSPIYANPTDKLESIPQNERNLPKRAAAISALKKIV